MAEQRYKTQVKQSLNELVISDLANIVNKFVQITSLGRRNAQWWTIWDGVCMTVQIRKNTGRTLMGLHETMNWGEFHDYTSWDGPDISATIKISDIFHAASELPDQSIVVFRFSDSNNWSLDIVE